ncbi:NAD(P)-dependent oxidoreductase [Sphingomonas sp.]|uniref:NAD-dependent epimerase/dehydratase family protein n=1 Tax=Sphingomonas sp. TaxID=28214 RepID=UPI0025E9905F|nr:NAD(P)-dependent oxidoreductase [Sphingomonas sp.]
MRVLVTGAAGLIGSGVAARLAADHDVIGLDLKPGEHVAIVGDCGDVAAWRHRLGGIEAIIHTAALHAPHVGMHSDADFRRTNVEATAQLIDLALAMNAGHFVLTSTTSLYGHALEAEGKAAWVDERREPEPRDIYDETKLEAERLVATAGGTMCVTSLRMSRCFPEPAEDMAWYRLYRGIDRRDVAEAHALALARSGSAATYVISAATPFRPEDCEELVRDAPSMIARRCPGLIEEMTSNGWLPPSSIDRVYDGGLAARELGFIPRYGIDSCLAGDWDPLPSR